jgi:long-chain acyl-CoA synthetase
MVFGNERNYVVALVTLDPDSIDEWATENGLGGKSYEEIVAEPKTREMVQGYVDTLNGELNRWETIKKFELLDHDLTVESGELTPSMKVKRNVVEGNYSGEIDKMYA